MNPVIDALIDLLMEMSESQDSGKMTDHIHTLFIAVNRAHVDDVRFLVAQLRTLKDGA